MNKRYVKGDATKNLKHPKQGGRSDDQDEDLWSNRPLGVERSAVAGDAARDGRRSLRSLCGQGLAHAGPQADCAVGGPGVALRRGREGLLGAGGRALPLVVVGAERELVLERTALVASLILGHGHAIQL